MTKPAPPRPTDAELAILRTLWKLGPSAVRDVHEALQRARPSGYTTTLKTMQIMTEKGLLRRDESRRSHVYAPNQSEEQTLHRIVKDLLERAFGGSAQKLVMQALSAKRASPAEIVRIRELLDEMENRNPGAKSR